MKLIKKNEQVMIDTSLLTISKIHQRFSKELKEPKVLRDPEYYLGPNYQAVLNFWIYLDSLSDEERKEMNNRYWALDGIVRDSAYVAAYYAADEVVNGNFRNAAWWAARYVTRFSVFGDAAEELIGHHKLIEKHKTPLALPLCIKS